MSGVRGKFAGVTSMTANLSYCQQIIQGRLLALKNKA